MRTNFISSFSLVKNGTASENSGDVLLEYYDRDSVKREGFICDNGWNEVNSRVICQKFGFTNGLPSYNGYFTGSKDNNNKLCSSNFHCKMNEYDFLNCSPLNNCQYGEVGCLSQQGLNIKGDMLMLMGCKEKDIAGVICGTDQEIQNILSRSTQQCESDPEENVHIAKLYQIEKDVTETKKRIFEVKSWVHYLDVILGIDNKMASNLLEATSFDISMKEPSQGWKHLSSNNLWDGLVQLSNSFKSSFSFGKNGMENIEKKSILIQKQIIEGVSITFEKNKEGYEENMKLIKSHNMDNEKTMNNIMKEFEKSTSTFMEIIESLVNEKSYTTEEVTFLKNEINELNIIIERNKNKSILSENNQKKFRDDTIELNQVFAVIKNQYCGKFCVQGTEVCNRCIERKPMTTCAKYGQTCDSWNKEYCSRYSYWTNDCYEYSQKCSQRKNICLEYRPAGSFCEDRRFFNVPCEPCKVCEALKGIGKYLLTFSNLFSLKIFDPTIKKEDLLKELISTDATLLRALRDQAKANIKIRKKRSFFDNIFDQMKDLGTHNVDFSLDKKKDNILNIFENGQDEILNTFDRVGNQLMKEAESYVGEVNEKSGKIENGIQDTDNMENLVSHLNMDFSFNEEKDNIMNLFENGRNDFFNIFGGVGNNLTEQAEDIADEVINENEKIVHKIEDLEKSIFKIVEHTSPIELLISLIWTMKVEGVSECRNIRKCRPKPACFDYNRKAGHQKKCIDQVDDESCDNSCKFIKKEFSVETASTSLLIKKLATIIENQIFITSENINIINTKQFDQENLKEKKKSSYFVKVIC